MTHPPVIVVDENDEVIGSEKLRDVWKKGLYHRIVRVIVEDRQGRILSQRRAHDMELYPRCWDVSAAGHVDLGMTYQSAARQELVEELGLAVGELEEIGYYKSHDTYKGRIFNRFNKIYHLQWNYTPELFNPEEVSEVRWFTKQELIDLVKSHPNDVSDGLRETVDLLYTS